MDYLLHSTAYYTLNNIPDGDKLPASELSTKRSSAKPAVKKPIAKTATANSKTLTYAEIEPLLVKNTCTACHQVNKRQVGPSFADIAKRKYSNERIVELIYKPEPKNWPEHETPMAAMPQVPRDEALKIASWINSLRAPAP
jgi:cytochrome c551/c552